MTAVKGLDFISTYNNSTIEQVNETPVRIIHLQNLLEAKKAAGRNKVYSPCDLALIQHRYATFMTLALSYLIFSLKSLHV